MKVAIVGSRAWEDKQAIQNYIAPLPPDDIIISGGAPGVDMLAAEFATRYNHIMIVVRPAWGRGKTAGFERNTVIVELADRVVAFWNGVSPGTKDTISKARAAGKPVEIIRPE